MADANGTGRRAVIKWTEPMIPRSTIGHARLLTLPVAIVAVAVAVAGPDARLTAAAPAAAAPGARVALLTVFAVAPGGTRALRQTDHVIVTAATATDPGVIIMDPLASQWKFQHANGGLHPTAAGDAWIARKVLAILRAYGVRPVPAATGAQPVICAATAGEKQAAGASA